jgi:acyl carrier protein
MAMAVGIEDIGTLMEAAAGRRVAIDYDTHIFIDAGLDSLTYMALIQSIEDEYNVWFSIMDLEPCLIVGTLVGLVNDKISEAV